VKAVFPHAMFIEVSGSCPIEVRSQIGLVGASMNRQLHATTS
jgi:hypothetical protein